MGKRTCSFDGCERDGWYHGKCWAHAARSPRAPLGTSAAERIQIYSDRDVNGCLVWNRYIDPTGYGRLRVNGRTMKAHRAAWEVKNGPIPDGMQIDHMCHNRACVNVGHLRLATQSENLWNRAGADSCNPTGARNIRVVNGAYRVTVGKNHQYYEFGRYSTLDEAKQVAMMARAELFGEFAGRG